jgi:hypothetical protein
MKNARRTLSVPAFCGLALALGCAGIKAQGSGDAGAGGSGAKTGSGGTGASSSMGSGGTSVLHRNCTGLECQQTRCIALSCDIAACGENEGKKTTLSGRVYDPAGRTPLYNIAVYVPNAPLDDIPEGLSCNTCDGTASGKPIASALTDASGNFTLDNVPVGSNIPLVLQVGKWRRQVTIPSTSRCQDNPVADADHNLLRLPRTQAEGHIPQIALSTGHADALDCLLRKIGIADSEFTNDAGSGRVHMYVGGAGATGNQGAKQLASGAVFADSYQTLFPSYDKLTKYDILMLQCESGQLESAKLPFVPNIRRYADNGGRLFAEHLHSVWIKSGLPPWPSTAAWLQSLAADLQSPITGNIDTSFPKGQALSDWLVAVGASTTPGQIQLMMGQHSVDAVTSAAQRWIYTTDPTASTQYLTFNTPVEEAAANQCGRVVFTDIHVANGDSSHPDVPFPGGCTTGPMTTPQEKALEFMFFDLSSCVQVDTAKPEPPIVVQ